MDRLTNWHAMVVHFPISLLFVSVLFDIVALHPRLMAALRPAALVTLVLGSLGTVAAVLTALEGNARGVTQLMRPHERWAQITMILFGLLSLWRLWLLWRKRSFLSVQVVMYLVVATVGLVTLTYTGHLGGRMVYEEAIGVQRNGAPVVQPVPFRRGVPRTPGGTNP